MDRNSLIQERASLVMQIFQLDTFLKDPVLADLMRAGVAKVGSLLDPVTQKPMADVTECTLYEAKAHFEEQLKVNEYAIKNLVS